MESIRQIHTDIQEVKNSIQDCQNCLNKTEDSVSDLEDRTVHRNPKMEDLLVTWDHDKTIQQLQDDAKKNNMSDCG